MRRGFAVVTLFATLAACSPGNVPEPLPVSTASEPVAVVSQEQLTRILEDVSETLAAADAASDRQQLQGRLGGPAAEMRAAEYELARLSQGENTVTPLTAAAQVAIVGATVEWPRVVQVITNVPEGTNLPLLLTLVQTEPRAHYELWSWVRLLPGVQMPPTVNPATGSPQVAADTDTLVASPQQVLERYADVLTTAESEHAGSFATDTFRELVAADIEALSAGAEDAGTVQQSVSVADAPTYALRTNDGGAIVVGALRRSVVFTRTVPRATLTVGSNLAFGGEVDVEGSLTSTFLVTVAFYVPPAGSSEPIELVGVEQVIVGAERDDSVSPD